MRRKSKSAFQGTDEGNHVVESQSFLLSLCQGKYIILSKQTFSTTPFPKTGTLTELKCTMN